MSHARSTPSRAASRETRPSGTALNGCEAAPATWALRQGGMQFDAVDIEILEWIASHARTQRRSGWLM
ncbi:MAG TPA: hypothetical protein VH249_19150 [Xanthobacteraceae bacterium]|jgi:hypothetical protein|nr:hypothetical protein [Xanthobacteraceae bacterium]